MLERTVESSALPLDTNLTGVDSDGDVTGDDNLLRCVNSADPEHFIGGGMSELLSTPQPSQTQQQQHLHNLYMQQQFTFQAMSHGPHATHKFYPSLARVIHAGGSRSHFGEWEIARDASTSDDGIDVVVSSNYSTSHS